MAKKNPPLSPHDVEGEKIEDKTKLMAVFGLLVKAKTKIAALIEGYKEQVASLDAQLEKDSKKSKATLEEWEPLAKNYCIDHRKELIAPGKKSAVVGPVRIEFKFGTIGVRTKAGQKVNEAELLAAIEELRTTCTPDQETILQGCVVYKPSLAMKALAELPQDLADALGITPYQEEKFSWTPNGER